MVKQVLFIQGAGEGVHDRWDNKLVASLERELGENYAVRYPHMPCEDNPRYAAWKATLVSEFAALEDGSILVGHSVGGTILTHVLAEQPPKVRPAGLFIIAAPFIGEGGWPSDDIDDGKDLSQRLPPGIPVHLYHGAADAEVPTAHVHLYAKAIPHAVVQTLEDRDHQLNNDLSEVARDIRSLG
ncbi:alpha/beta fold hydrolase [Rhizobium leguminosarum]|jgi:predicted alpha/beta hydrolase family esterase|uniref:Alpha/beta fold hydrolase n=1 Tax=Rhizobium leguminosarum TaxID=384 RepID=A0A444I7Y8_RHILE|nr:MULTISPECIES: alpha/beta fold hydrolase [Rhizobium]MBY5457864.1 alpha/beta fold hydrolase [Rhizobium leguminosarum]NKL66696.1 alpha/beta fold hydrolase [Rhizobium leguminosarum bv. viciae]RWX04901.1 alpha/beta fold hydrolase [Rhizobium leguminosarum]RWX34646.1 alpha/beta fold hydrolase [Rhizobium leguminosarum]TAU53715.1 alpha/beta fold hydrolase [Rhizobium leguminosarum]